MDFTRKKYVQLITRLKESGYEFITYTDYCEGELPTKFVILRHDVDLKPRNSLAIAEDERQMSIKATYYFRAVPESWDDDIIKSIHHMGHEIGYHYESLATCRGNMKMAYADFTKNLARLRELTPVSTICMHGCPRSLYDSKDLWKYFDYRCLKIIGEPYLTTDFSKVFYLTDTGRRWDGYKVSVRDRIDSYQELWNTNGWTFHSTNEIIMAIQENRLSNQIMITTHPQRWNEFGLTWIYELIIQNVKNVVKRILIKKRKK